MLGKEKGSTRLTQLKRQVKGQINNGIGRGSCKYGIICKTLVSLPDCFHTFSMEAISAFTKSATFTALTFDCFYLEIPDSIASVYAVDNFLCCNAVFDFATSIILTFPPALAEWLSNSSRLKIFHAIRTE